MLGATGLEPVWSPSGRTPGLASIAVVEDTSANVDVKASGRGRPDGGEGFCRCELIRERASADRASCHG